MKKLTRKSLDELARIMPVIDTICQNKIKGGDGAFDCLFQSLSYIAIQNGGDPNSCSVVAFQENFVSYLINEHGYSEDAAKVAAYHTPVMGNEIEGFLSGVCSGYVDYSNLQNENFGGGFYFDIDYTNSLEGGTGNFIIDIGNHAVVVTGGDSSGYYYYDPQNNSSGYIAAGNISGAYSVNF